MRNNRIYLVLKSWIKKNILKKQSYTFPLVINITNINEKKLLFRVYSQAEKTRIESFGKEKECWEKFLGILKSDDIIFDIGASIGLYTIASANLVRNGKLYAFEPDPTTRSRLGENIRLNQIKKVTIVPWAVSNLFGKIDLFTEGASGQNSPSISRTMVANSPRRKITIRTNSLDNAIANKELDIPDVLKIDIEGAEGLLFMGALKLLRGEFGKKPRFLLLELHPNFLPANGLKVNDIKELMIKNGYTVTWSENRLDQEHLLYQI